MRSRLAEEVAELIRENERLKDGPLAKAIAAAVAEMERQKQELICLREELTKLKLENALLKQEASDLLVQLEETKNVLKAYRENIEIGYPSHKAMMLAKGGS